MDSILAWHPTHRHLPVTVTTAGVSENVTEDA